MQPGEMKRAFEEQGLLDVIEIQLMIRMTYGDFEDYWAPVFAGEGPLGKYVGGLDANELTRVEAAVRDAYEAGGRTARGRLRASLGLAGASRRDAGLRSQGEAPSWTGITSASSSLWPVAGNSSPPPKGSSSTMRRSAAASRRLKKQSAPSCSTGARPARSSPAPASASSAPPSRWRARSCTRRAKSPASISNSRATCASARRTGSRPIISLARCATSPSVIRACACN